MSAGRDQTLADALDYLRMPEVTKGKYAVVPVNGDREAVTVIEAAIAEMRAENAHLQAELDAVDRAFEGLEETDRARRVGHWIGVAAAAETQARDAEAERTKLEAEIATLRADKDRLDFLDRCNASLNATYGTTYRWQLVMSHNVNRLLLGAGAVDLHDSAAGNTALPSCWQAIDRKRAELARERGGAS